MKYIISFIIYSISLTSFIIHPAADDYSLSSSPGGTWTSYLTNSVGALVGWAQKKTGTKPIGYCIDKDAQQLLKSSEQFLELSFADSRSKEQTKTYLRLTARPDFQQMIKQLNDRAHFEWEHIRTSISEDRHQDVAKFWKNNRINLSPCLRVAIGLYLEQNKDRRKAANNPREHRTRFDLSLIEHESGYIEASIPEIPYGKLTFPELTKIIRDYSDLLTIASPILSAERRVRKTFDPSFSLHYLTSAAEVEKAKHVYAVYFAHLFSAIRMKDPLSTLFKNPEFLAIFNQVWDRDSHLRPILADQLTRGSLEACSIFANHQHNISPLYAMLVSDMILSHEQKDLAQYVSKPFNDLYFETHKPHGKYIFMFLNSLSAKQKIALSEHKEEISSFAEAEQSAQIHSTIRANKAQLQLLAEIQGGKHIPQLLAAIERAKLTAPQHTQTVSEPIQIKETSSLGSITDLPVAQISQESPADLGLEIDRWTSATL